MVYNNAPNKDSKRVSARQQRDEIDNANSESINSISGSLEKLVRQEDAK